MLDGFSVVVNQNMTNVYQMVVKITLTFLSILYDFKDVLYFPITVLQQSHENIIKIHNYAKS